MTKITASIGKEKYKTEIKSSTNTLISDEPADIDGKDLGFSPTELLISSLASCTGITLRMYADRKEWDLQEAIIDVSFESDLNETPQIIMHIRLFGHLDEAQRARLTQIANSCPIHKMLQKSISIETFLKD